MDNAPAHPPQLEEVLDDEYNFIKIQFLPPNTTSLLQPMDQCVIANFKKLYIKSLFQKCFQVTTDTELTVRDFWKKHFNILHCLHFISQAWEEVSVRTLRSAWKNLWANCVQGTALEGPESEVDIVNAVVSMGKTMNLEVNESDIEELVEEHNVDLTTEELQELRSEQEKEKYEEEKQISSGDEEDSNTKEAIKTCDVKKILQHWGELEDLVSKWHPNQVVVSRATNIFNDNVINHFRKVLRKRQIQSSLDRFFKPPSPKKQKEAHDDN